MSISFGVKEIKLYSIFNKEEDEYKATKYKIEVV